MRDGLIEDPELVQASLDVVAGEEMLLKRVEIETEPVAVH